MRRPARIDGPHLHFGLLDCLDGRPEARHLAFGNGLHACIGAALARLEMEVVLGTLRARYPGLRLVEDDIAWNPNPAIRSPRRLIVRAS